MSNDNKLNIVSDTSREQSRIDTIAKLKSEGKCIWDMAWIGFCGENPHRGYGRQGPAGNGIVVSGTDYCKMHTVPCIGKHGGCTNVATYECDVAGSLVCGAPLCNECTQSHTDRHYRRMIG